VPAEIDTVRLLLRRFHEDDVALLVELDSDPDVMHYLSGGAATPAEQIRSAVLPIFMRHNGEASVLGGWAVELRENGDFLGWVSLRLEAPGIAELGYRFRRAAWGRGFATEACRALLGLAFEGGIERVFATTYEENTASRNVMVRLGMRFMRSFRYEPGGGETHAGDPGDAWPGEDVEYEMTAADWAALSQEATAGSS